MTNSQLYTWDFTIPVNRNEDVNSLMKNLSEWAKKWVFQKEKGKRTGYLHWQGRLSLIKRLRKDELIGRTKDIFPGVRWSATCKTVHEGQNFNYVMKADTRVEGPWKDADYEEPPPLTRQLKAFMDKEMRPWQEDCMNLCKELDDRSIKVIVATEGNEGKSITSEFLEYHGLAYEIPPFRLMEDIMQCVMSIPSKKCYIIDMPRAMKKDKLSEFYAGLEALKNGVAYDKRYSFKKRRMDRPQVIVFTNVEPEWNYMSRDRWEVYDITSDYQLAPRNAAEEFDLEANESALSRL